MSSEELTEWMAFSTIEPFGGRVPFIGHAITAATIANVNRGKGPEAKIEDFMPVFKREEEQPVDQMLSIAAMMTSALGGEVKI